MQEFEQGHGQAKSAQLEDREGAKLLLDDASLCELCAHSGGGFFLFEPTLHFAERDGLAGDCFFDPHHPYDRDGESFFA